MNKANETKAYYANKQAEDKKLFVENLGWLLSQTRNDIERCEYVTDNEDEIVNIVYSNGYKKQVNINLDSYIAIVKDVAKAVS